jgi:mannose-6-phosphate isomerase-like protein (cupin superfamily)
MMNRLTPSNALKQLADSDGVPFAEVFRHGSLQVEIYKPDGVDHQTPHTRDEVYVVISGSGQFINGDTRRPFEAGEVLFVPAGVDHRFVDFTDDFATWVFFYGPEGGEGGSGTSGS